MAILNTVHNCRMSAIENALRVQELMAEVTDLMYFEGGSSDFITESISPRQLELAGNKVSEILILEPDNVDALRLAAIYLFRRKQFDECIGYLKKAIRLAPDVADLYGLLGRALSEKGEHEQAITQFQKAADIDPAILNTHIGLGVSYFNLKRYLESTASFEKAVAVDPDSIYAHFNLGYVYFFCGRLEKARAEFCKVIAEDHDFPSVHKYMARLLYYQGRIEDLNEYDPRAACPRIPAAPRIITPFVLLGGRDELTGEDSTVKMWINPSTGEPKPIGEWWD